jgi:hypothetical protein
MDVGQLATQNNMQTPEPDGVQSGRGPLCTPATGQPHSGCCSPRLPIRLAHTVASMPPSTAWRTPCVTHVGAGTLPDAPHMLAHTGVGSPVSNNLVHSTFPSLLGGLACHRCHAMVRSWYHARAAARHLEYTHPCPQLKARTAPTHATGSKQEQGNNWWDKSTQAASCCTAGRPHGGYSTAVGPCTGADRRQHGYRHVVQLKMQSRYCYRPVQGHYTTDFTAHSHPLNVGTGPGCLLPHRAPSGGRREGEWRRGRPPPPPMVNPPGQAGAIGCTRCPLAATPGVWLPLLYMENTESQSHCPAQQPGAGQGPWRCLPPGTCTLRAGGNKDAAQLRGRSFLAWYTSLVSQ